MPPSSNSNIPPITAASQQKKSHVGLVVSIILGILLIATLVFAFWAYTERQDYKVNSDKKADTAVTVAVEKAKSEKDNEFLIKEKEPNKKYTGPDNYGTIVFMYPKTWSAYEVNVANSTPLSSTFHPNVVPGGDTQKYSYALRVEVINSSYDGQVKQYDTKVKTGTVKANAYRPKNVQDVVGLRLEGEIVPNKQGVLIILPLRDKTIKIWTESKDYIKDLDSTILETLTFVP